MWVSCAVGTQRDLEPAPTYFWTHGRRTPDYGTRLINSALREHSPTHPSLISATLYYFKNFAINILVFFSLSNAVDLV